MIFERLSLKQNQIVFSSGRSETDFKIFFSFHPGSGLEGLRNIFMTHRTLDFQNNE